MLDDEVIDAAAPDERRAKTSAFVLSAAGLGVLLSVAFFPIYFSVVENYDDEGSFLVAIQHFRATEASMSIRTVRTDRSISRWRVSSSS